MSKKSDKKRIVLLDAHAIIHRAYHALPDFTSSKGEPTGALYGTILMILKIIEDLKPDYMVACYDLPDTTFRKEVYEDYKAGRKEIDNELIHQLIRSKDIMKVFNIPIYEKSGFEADDILGTIVEQTKNKKDIDIIIASGDLDTMQLVDNDKVQIYTLKKGIKDTILYNEKAVFEKMGFDPKLIPDYKGLRGDPSDNIIGIAGIGEKTATTLIQNFGSIEQIYKKLKSKNGEEEFKKIKITQRIIGLLKDGEDDALFSKELATIRLDVPIKFELSKGGWKEGADFEKINELLRDFGFRSLVERVKGIFALSSVASAKESYNLEIIPPSDEKEIEKIGIALWLCNSNMTNPEIEDILNYANTQDFEVAKTKILKELKEKELEKIWEEIELPIIPVIKKIGERGIKVNKDYLKKLSEEYHKELDILQKNIWKQAGGEFNINSPKQMGEVLFDKMGISGKGLKKTSTGARSTNIEVLKKLQEENPIIDDILKYRELQKLLSTYIDNIPQMLDEDNRLHTSFMQAGTTTGRMASREPNLQNIPIKTELGRNIRKGFVASEGFKLVAFDYSQIELRLAAFLSEDEKMIEIFKKGDDIHSAVASAVFEVPFDEVDKEMRRKAKVINFGIMYGMGVNSLSKELRSDRKEAQKYLNEYFEKFPQLAKYLEDIKIETAQKGYTETYFGRRRYFEGINSKVPFVKAMAERMAINAPIQGTEGDIVRIAMIKVDEYLRENNLEKDAFALLQVHDELIYEIKEDLVEKVAPEIEKIMENVIPITEAKGIKFEVNTATGNSWGEI
jgi:DNA polymerase-1